jgi:hypothetical protein
MLDSRMLGLVPAWAFLLLGFIVGLRGFLNPTALALGRAGKQMVSSNQWLFRWVIAFPIMLLFLIAFLFELLGSPLLQ